MKFSQRQIKFVSVFVGLIFLLVGQAQSQEKKPLNLNDIAAKLTFTSRVDKFDERINRKLIRKVRTQKVDFILEPEDEKSLRKAGANDLLIQAIRESLPKEVEKRLLLEKDEITLYKQFVDNYKGNIEQKKKALQAAKEFLEKYSEGYELEDGIQYLKKAILSLEKDIGIEKQID